MPPSYRTHNVAAESQDPDSILNLYKKVLALRHTNAALLEGSYVPLNERDAHVMSYLRSYKGNGVLVALNMSPARRKARFELARHGFSASAMRPLIASGASISGSAVTLDPYGLMIAEVKP